MENQSDINNIDLSDIDAMDEIFAEELKEITFDFSETKEYNAECGKGKKTQTFVDFNIDAEHFIDSMKNANTFRKTKSVNNIFTRHCQRFWGASGNFWQRQWDRTYGLFGKDDVMISIWGTLLVTTSVFWLANALLIILDLTGHPSFLLKYKIQRKTHPLPLPMLWKAVRVVVFNQVAIGIPFIIVTYQLMKMRGCDIDGELPTFQWVVFELLVFSLVEEICFYYCHRFLHCPLLYKYFHKWHHEWTSPIGITSIYAHPLEHVISNLMPPGLGPLLMGSHLATAWMWFSLALISTTVAHCGYHFPFLPSPEAHDFHHLKFSQNYGVLGVLDRLHGTDMLFRKSRAYQRDILLIGFTPVSQQFPDSPSKKSK